MDTTTTTQERTMDDYTQTTITIAGAEVTVYGGAMHPIRTYSTKGHVTGWLKRHGARTTYAELNCTCHLTAELVHPLGRGTWLTYGEEGWVETLNRLALEHVTNALENPYMIRPAGGDDTRRSDRIRVTEADLREAMRAHGLSGETLPGEFGHIAADDGTRFEQSRFANL